MAAAGQGLRVFISYARRDCAAFAEELLQGLELAGFDPFLDRHDIAAGEDWEARLSGLIHSADTVVFVISPASVGSERCGWEVERAQALSKRIIPIVAAEVPEEQTPEGLRRRNYIFFSEGHSFVGALAQLSKALRTDVEWIREHTRLGELAERWRAKQKAEPMLLRGSELEGAKAWLSAWKAPAPEPTNAHREFIGESEAAEADRYSAERKRLEEMAALQKEREVSLVRSRRRVFAGLIVLGLMLAGTIASGFMAMAQARRALAMEARVHALEARLTELTESAMIQQAQAVQEQAIAEPPEQAAARAPDPVFEGLRRIRAELPSSAPEPATRTPVSERLSASFTVADLTVSETARQRGVSNTPTPEALANLRHTAEQLERVRAVLRNAQINIVAAYRSPEVTALVGGSPTSDHMLGYSVDFTADAFGTPYEIMQAIMASPELMAEVDQLIYEKGRWVHISFASPRREQVLTAYERAETGRRTHYAPGLHRLDEEGRMVAEAPQSQSGPAQRPIVRAHPTEP